ncbi:MAG: hypothetical protein M1831_004817 [Alyxoria varia]|nr:MAG: hypothetical protein M1831_004817 [Alyxoria varia]
MSTHSSRAVYDSLAWVFCGLATVTTALRLYARTNFRIRESRAGWDDAIIIVACFLNIATAILYTLALETGTGQHIHDLSPTEQVTAIKINLIATGLCIMDWSIPKISIAILLDRILCPRPLMKTVLYSLAGVSFSLAIVTTIITFVHCQPVAGNWNPERYDPMCWSPDVLTNVSIAVGSWAAFTDFALALYPSTVLWRLQMPLQKTIGLSFILGLGIVACIVACYKTSLLPAIGERGDLTYYSNSIVFWSLIEADAGIIAACLPTLKPVFEITRSFCGKVRSYTSTAGATAREKSSSQNPYDHKEYGDGVELISGMGQGVVAKKVDVSVDRERATENGEMVPEPASSPELEERPEAV